MNPPSIFSEKTLVPVSLVISICALVYWLSTMESRIENHRQRLDLHRDSLMKMRDRQDEYDRRKIELLNDIWKRISTIEGVLLEKHRLKQDKVKKWEQ